MYDQDERSLESRWHKINDGTFVIVPANLLVKQMLSTLNIKVSNDFLEQKNLGENGKVAMWHDYYNYQPYCLEPSVSMNLKQNMIDLIVISENA